MVTRIGPLRPIKLYLREWREHLGLTQEQAAERMETTKGTISRWEKRALNLAAITKGSDITLGGLARLAEAYGIPMENFNHHPDRPSPEQLMKQAHQQIEEVAKTLLKTGT